MNYTIKLPGILQDGLIRRLAAVIGICAVMLSEVNSISPLTVVSASSVVQVQAGTATASDTDLQSLSLKQIYRKMSANFMKRKKRFSIVCRYNNAVKKIVNGLNGKSNSSYYKILYEMAVSADKPGNADDGDYLYGNLGNMQCYYADGRLNFYAVEYFETNAQTKKVNAFAARTATKIRKKTSVRLEQIEYTYAYVINHVRYDNRKNFNSSAYAGFVKQKTVCNGYALMVYKILEKLGIRCHFISGSVNDGSRWYLHAWNKVRWKGKWYNLDACSDDEDDGEVYADYFMKSNKKFRKTHRQDTFIRI